MAAAIVLRADYGAGDLRRLAKASRDARQTRRLLALAVICDGGSRTEAARVGGVTLQIIRDWVLRFNAEGPPGLIDRKAPGKPALLQAEHRAALAAAVEAGPRPYLDGVVRWRLVELVQWLWERFGLSVSRQTLGGSCGRWAMPSSPPGRGTTRRIRRPRTSSKKSPGCGRGHPRAPPRRHARRAVVPGRGADRPEEQDSPKVGAARHAAAGSP
jgi:transposase